MIHRIRRAQQRLTDRIASRRLLGAGIELGERVTVQGRCIASRHPQSRIRVGAGSTLVSTSSRQVLGINHPVVLRTIRADACLLIGDEVGISGGSIVCAHSISIGDGTLLGANVTIIDTDFHPLSHPQRASQPLPEPRASDAVVIGPNVFIGTNAIILKGTRLGRDCVVGAGAVVSGSHEDGAVLVGSPARRIKTLHLPAG